MGGNGWELYPLLGIANKILLGLRIKEFLPNSTQTKIYYATKVNSLK